MSDSPASTPSTGPTSGTLSPHPTLVILDRSARPGSRAGGPVLPTPSGACPFCPGAEHRLCQPQQVRYDSTGARTAISVPNVSPLVATPGSMHEVVVLTGDHDGHLLESASRPPSCRPGLELLADRMRTARGRGLVAHGIVNHGVLAGASQPHAHAQLLAVEAPSSWLTAELGTLTDPDTCPLCEPATGTVLTSAGPLVVIAPLHPTYSQELVVAPRTHDRLFDVADEEALDHLAQLLREVGRLTRAAWGEHAYNLVFHQSPTDADLHWHVHVVPRLAPGSGFELDWSISLGTGRDTVAKLGGHARQGS